MAVEAADLSPGRPGTCTPTAWRGAGSRQGEEGGTYHGCTRYTHAAAPPDHPRLGCRIAALSCYTPCQRSEDHPNGSTELPKEAPPKHPIVSTKPSNLIHQTTQRGCTISPNRIHQTTQSDPPKHPIGSTKPPKVPPRWSMALNLAVQL